MFLHNEYALPSRAMQSPFWFSRFLEFSFLAIRVKRHGFAPISITLGEAKLHFARNLSRDRPTFSGDRKSSEWLHRQGEIHAYQVPASSSELRPEHRPERERHKERRRFGHTRC